MKPFFQCLVLLFMLLPSLDNQAQNPYNQANGYLLMDQWTMGEWYNPVDNVVLILRPMKELDVNAMYNNGQWNIPQASQYEIRMNGQSYTDNYWINGTTMALNNYATFTILGLDEQSMYLQDSYGGGNTPIIQLLRKGASPVTSPQTTFTTSKLNPSVLSQIHLPAPKFRQYQKKSTQVLASVNGQTLTEGDFQKTLEVWEYVIGEPLSDFDIQQERQRTITQFTSNPQQTLQNIAANQQTMQQLYQIQNPRALGFARAAIAYGLSANPQLPGAREDIALFSKYETILATDSQTGVALLEKDLQGLLKMVVFVNKLSNPNFQLDATTEQTFRQNAIQNYSNLSIEEKQSIAAMHITYQMMAAQWNQMNPQQKLEAAKKMVGNNTSPTTSNGSFESAQANLQRLLAYGKSTGDVSSYIDRNTYNTMSNISLQNHVGMLNAAEAIGGSSDYWTIRDRY